jgi:type I restriction enzyme S subunit
LAAFAIALPSRQQQLAIGTTIRALDDKIELNRRMGETLEAMARALFESCFVDFEPVRAKAEGRDPGLPPPVADLFPSLLEDSELGQIPAGWNVEPLGNLVEFSYGKALKESSRTAGSVPVFGSRGRVGWHDEKLANGPGIIIGRKGNPGAVTWAQTDFFAIDTTFYVVPKATCPSPYFLFYALQAQDLASLSADSAVPGLNRNMAYLSRQLVPPQPVVKAFDDYVRPLFDRRHTASRESATLAAIRDALLPRLISGELHLSLAERLLQAALV